MYVALEKALIAVFAAFNHKGIELTDIENEASALVASAFRTSDYPYVELACQEIRNAHFKARIQYWRLAEDAP